MKQYDFWETELFQSSSLSQGEQQRLVDLALQKAGYKPVQKEQNTMKKSRKSITAILIAAAVMACTATAVGATAYFNWDQRLAEYFQLNDKQGAEGTGTNIQQTVSCNGVDVTVQQTISGYSSLYLLVDVTLPDGVQWEEQTRFAGERMEVAGASGIAWNSKQLGQQQGNKVTLLYQITANTPLDGKQVDFRLGDLSTYQNGTYTSIVSGEWDFQWTLDFEDRSRTLALQTSDAEDGCQLTQAILSPLSVDLLMQGGETQKEMENKDADSVTIHLESQDQQTGLSFDAQEEPQSDGSLIYRPFTLIENGKGELCLTMSDGSQVISDDWTSMDKNGSSQMTWILPQLIDPQQVVAITLDGNPLDFQP